MTRAGACVALLVIALAGCGDGAAVQGSPMTSPAPTATADADTQARGKARDLAGRDKYLAAVAVLENAEMDAEADRMRRRGSRALYRSARRALDGGKYKTAHRLATESRKLRKTAAARKVQTTANAKIAAAAAAERERQRLARIARDQRTCSGDEKQTVRDGAATPPGCATYASELAAKRAEEEAAQATASSEECDSNYEGACLKPDSSDYDCAGGSGDGPDYTGPVQSVGDDPYDLDRDGDGSACETS
jgi:hypothetical protein